MQDNQIRISMTENGDPLENAVAERVNGILKGEYLRHCQPATVAEAASCLQQAVTCYNQQRPHWSLGLLTPEQVHTQNLNTEKLWKNYYRKNSNQNTIIVNPLQDYQKTVNIAQD